MKNILKRLLIGASITASMSAIASAPAHAGSITNVSIGGTAATDYYVYDVDATGAKTVRLTNPTGSDLQKVLGGNAQSPTGNVELAASSEQSGFDFTNSTTSLNGTIDGKNIQLSSLTASDWTPTFVNTWLTQALSANSAGLSSKSVALLTNSTSVAFLAKIFEDPKYGGEQRFSDPNISYVNENDSTGLISIGLAGHYDATSLLTSAIGEYIADKTVSSSDQSTAKLLLSLLPKTIQASEIVKVTYNGGPSQLLYGFSATKSGLVAADDGVSHSGNYEVTIQTPEPSALLGLLGVGGVFAAQRQLKKASRRSCTLRKTKVSG